MEQKILLFDLDGTLLKSDNTISKRTFEALEKCKSRGVLIGIATSRSEYNIPSSVYELAPDIFISSGGALVRYKNDYIYKAGLSASETSEIIETARALCGEKCQITVDTTAGHYQNLAADATDHDPAWDRDIYTDFIDFSEPSLKVCVQIKNKEAAEEIKNRLSQFDIIRFINSHWYKFSAKNATKEAAIIKVCEKLEISVQQITAFGDDLADIGMLKLCGVGIAMGNASKKAKKSAALTIGSNDEDGIADYLEENFLKIGSIAP